MKPLIDLGLQFLAVFFLFWGVAGFLLGLGLMFATAQTVAFMQKMNRWVSTRAVLKPVEIPHNVDGAAKRHPYWFGGLLIVASAYVIVVLLGVGARSAAGAFAGPAGPNSMYAIFAEFLWWVFLVGAFAAIAVGAALAFSPGSWSVVEAKLNAWQSTRQAVRGGDEMHISVLDRWAASRPLITGAVIAAGSLAMGAASWALLLPR